MSGQKAASPGKTNRRLGLYFNGRWATDPDYAELIVELGNAIFGDTL